MSEHLKPCPFCGGGARKAFRSGNKGRTPFTQSKWFRGAIFCAVCKSSGPLKNNPCAAVEAWNKRAVAASSLTQGGGNDGDR